MINLSRHLAVISPVSLTILVASFSASLWADTAQVDASLVESLQAEQDVREETISQGMPGLTPEEIITLRRLVNDREAARNNPEPPKVTNKVTLIERGDSPTINIMERFDTTLIFADRHGDPIEITDHRVNDENAATLVPLYSNEMPEGQPASSGAESDMVSPDSGNESDGEGPVTALVLIPEKAMRSTNITVKLKGQTHPIIITVSTRSSMDTSEELAYLQELRLTWVSNMPSAQAIAGKFIGSSGNTILSDSMVSLVQGIPTDNMVPKALEGSLSNQVSLWHDEVDDIWYLRMAEHIEPWNISIEDRTRDSLRGFIVAELQSEPPSLIGFTANGRYSTLTLIGD